MVFNFRIVSDEVDNFKREIKIDAHNTFLDLHNAICDSVGYRKNEMSSFFLCDKGWEKEREITLEDMGVDDTDEEVYVMDECVLSDFIEDEGQRLLFTFDYLNDRSFFIEMKEMITGRDLLDPVCSLSVGKAPDQYVEPELLAKEPAEKLAQAAKPTTLDDFDDPLYGDEEFNPEEFDEEGFSEMNFED